MVNLNVNSLRRIAWLSLAIVLLIDLVLSARSRAGLALGVIMLAICAVAIVVVSLVFMPKEAAVLLRNKDLLVPLAFVVTADKLLGWLSAAPFVGMLFKPALPLHLFNLSFGISMNFLFQVALAVAYAAWVTAMLVELARAGASNPCLVLPEAMRRFWRVFGIELVGWTVVLVGTSMLLLTMPVLQFFALVPLAIFGVVWNYVTAAALPVAYESPSGFWVSFRAGVIASVGNLGNWWCLLLLQMILLGLIFFYHSSSAGHTNVSWSVNVVWTGGYENECRWYGKVAEVLQAPKLPLVETLLSLLFGAFAVAIKVAVVRRLRDTAPSAQPPMIPSDAGVGTAGQDPGS